MPIGSKVFVATAEKQLNALSMDVAAIVTLPDSQLKLLFNNHGDTFLLTLEQACAYNHAAKQYNQSKAVKEEKAEMFPLFYTDRV